MACNAVRARVSNARNLSLRTLQPRHRLAPYRKLAICASVAKKFQKYDSDYVVLGAGIIGLACARALLQSDPDVTVTLLEQADELCSQYTGAATGAGQGYIWMGHRDPKNVDMWKLAARGTALWEQEAADMGEAGGMSFHPQGSLIISSDAETAYMLEQRAADLAAEGIEAAMVTPAQCAELEPLLNVPRSGAGLRVAADFQLDARGATSYLLRCCERLGGLGSPGGPGGRFRMHFGCSVHHISVDCCSGAFATVATSSGDVRAMKGAVIAMGCASAQVMVDSFYDQLYTQLLRKRWGLLLEVPYPEGAPRLRHGTMDVSYMGHTGAVAQQGAQAAPPPVLSLTEDTEEVSFTAATSSRGTLLLGSSWHERPSMAQVDVEAVAGAIVEEACAFLPGLAPHLRSVAGEARTRSGPRPASRRGQPYIGRVPGCEGLIMAAGHEGSGLTMALSTAELVAALLRDRPLPDYADSFAL